MIAVLLKVIAAVALLLLSIRTCIRARQTHRHRDEDFLLPPLIVGPKAAHTSSVIMLHGMYYDGSMYAALPEILAQYVGSASAAGTRFVFANAPKRTIDWPSGREEGVRAWYNYFTENGGTFECDEIDETHMAQVARAVQVLIDAEAASLGGDYSRVVLGGNSQGGTVALHAALTHPRGGELGGLFCGCTLLMRQTPVDAARHALPVYVFTAEKDEEFPPAFQRRCYERLREAGFAVRSHIEPGLSHYVDSTAELHHAASWVAERLYGQTKMTVMVRDVPKAKLPRVRTIFEL